MRAFWWFKENSVAGMARPGFNSTPWFEFPFEEALLVGWIGQHSSGSASMESFLRHVQEYGAKILRFYEMEGAAAARALEAFRDPGHLDSIFRRITSRSRLLQSHEVACDRISFHFSEDLLRQEISALRERGIKKVVSLTESHHSKDDLDRNFHATHISINDLDAPRLEQVQQLAEILREAREKEEKVAVHCLAGIGRTSTMLISAHMVLGERLESLQALVARQNPSFVFAGRQADFVRELAERLGSSSSRSASGRV